MSLIAGISKITVTPITEKQLRHVISNDTGENASFFLQLFRRIADKEWSLLFDTAGSEKSNGRFNIMVWNPALVVAAKEGQTELIDIKRQKRYELDEKPFEASEKYLHAHVVKLRATIDVKFEHLPFIVGVAGMAGYDAGRFYESLPSKALNDYTTPDFAAGLYLNSFIEDTKTGTFYYCSTDDSTFPDILDTKLDKTPNSSACSSHGVSETNSDKKTFSITEPFASNLSQGEYERCIDAIHRYLKAGDCYQVNMAQRFTARFQGDFYSAYCRLRNENQAPFSAYFKLPESAIASISPERFLSVKEGLVETKPIKGTRPRYAEKQRDAESAYALQHAEKDRSENLMIVDLLRNDISKHCKPGSVNVPALFALESYEAVHHLVSTITGELAEGSTPLDLLASSFPGGSITGAPKIRAMEVIDELEPHRRNIYCGSIFYMGCREDMDSSICIRTVLAEDDKLYCWAGGGIVLDSQADEEYQETLDKVSKIVPVLAKFNERTE